MKKWVSGTLILVVVLISSLMVFYHASKESTYQTNLKKGNSAVKDQNYSQAKEDFQKALAAKPDSKKANASVSQVENFTDGETQLKSNDFTTAKNSFRLVADDGSGSAYLTNQAQQKLTLVNSITENRTQFNQIYTTAVKQHNANDYKLSNETLDGILEDGKIKQSYYKDLLDKAMDLKKSNDNELNENKVPTNSRASVTNKVSNHNVYTNPQ